MTDHPNSPWPHPPKRYDTGALRPEDEITEHRDLCLFLGGDETSFTGDLLRLIAKADGPHRLKLYGAFPRHVAAWEMWVVLPTMTALDLAVQIERMMANALDRHLDEAPR